MHIDRVWGGGIYQHDEFYRLCDELGVMVKPSIQLPYLPLTSLSEHNLISCPFRNLGLARYDESRVVKRKFTKDLTVYYCLYIRVYVRLRHVSKGYALLKQRSPRSSISGKFSGNLFLNWVIDL